METDKNNQTPKLAEEVQDSQMLDEEVQNSQVQAEQGSEDIDAQAKAKLKAELKEELKAELKAELGFARQNHLKTNFSQYARQEANATPARKLADGALLVALGVILGIIAGIVPILGIVAVFLWPIPLILLAKRYGFLFGLLGFGAVGLLLILFLGPIQALMMLLNMGIIGLWYSFCFRKNLSAGKTLFGGVIFAACSVIIALVVSSWTIGLALSSIMDQLHQIVDQAVNQTVAMYSNMGVMEKLAGNATVAEFTASLKKSMLVLLPAALIIVSMIMATISYGVTGTILKRLGYQVNKLPRFIDWHLPWVCLWGLIIALLAQLATSYLDLNWLQPVSLNILYLYMPILIVAGISLVLWFGKMRNMPMLKVFLIVGIIILTQYVFYLLLMLGLMDCVVDFRSMFNKTMTDTNKQQ